MLGFVRAVAPNRKSPVVVSVDCDRSSLTRISNGSRSVFQRAHVVAPVPSAASRPSGSRPVMASTTIAGAKICCKCGADVAGKKRLKDHHGAYWCADCSADDEKRKRLLENGICAGCGDAFFGHDLTVIGHAT